MTVFSLAVYKFTEKYKLFWWIFWWGGV